MMIDHIDIEAGKVAWPRAALLLNAAWPPNPPQSDDASGNKDDVSGNADQRVLAFNRDNEIICHVGIFLRDATWDGRGVKIGGIGGVTTREDSRRRGVASAAMRRATQEIRETYKGDFGLLFCDDPRNAALYLGLGWLAFKGDVLVMQSRGHVRFDHDAYVFDIKIAPRTGVLDLCGLPW